MPESVCILSVTMSRVAPGVDGPFASGSSAGSRTICVCIFVIFMESAWWIGFGQGVKGGATLAAARRRPQPAGLPMKKAGPGAGFFLKRERLLLLFLLHFVLLLFRLGFRRGSSGRGSRVGLHF